MPSTPVELYFNQAVNVKNLRLISSSFLEGNREIDLGILCCKLVIVRVKVSMCWLLVDRVAVVGHYLVASCCVLEREKDYKDGEEAAKDGFIGGLPVDVEGDGFSEDICWLESCA